MRLQSFKIFEPYIDRMSCAFSESGANFAYEDFGDSQESFLELAEEMDFDPDQICLARQDHVDKVAVVEADTTRGLKSVFTGVDGFITAVSGIPLMVKVADCQAVFLYDPEKNVIAAVHSGWRGNAQNIIGKSVRRMVNEFGVNAKNILAAVGASLGPCCAEFSDPLRELPVEMHKYINDHHVDLWECAKDQLTAEGVLLENIEIKGECSRCHADKYYSYRRGDAERMMGVIMMK